MNATRVRPIDLDHPDPSIIAEAARILREGGLVAFAAETVYGLGADATNPDAVARIFEAKGRPPTNPLIVHVADRGEALACVADWPARAEILARRFWPGPLTLVLPRSPIIPDIVTAGQSTVGVRVPSTNVARRLIAEAGRPIAAPSANRSTGISPTLAEHVVKDLGASVDLILDSGPTRIGLESTVLDLSGGQPRVLRPGTITEEELAETLGEPLAGPLDPPDHAEPARSPGLMAVHYSPRTPTYRWVRGDLPASGRYSLIMLGEGTERPPTSQGHRAPCAIDHLADPGDASRNLYARLHHLDQLGLDFILIVPPPDEPRWRAVRDRIRRASRPWPGP